MQATDLTVNAGLIMNTGKYFYKFLSLLTQQYKGYRNMPNKGTERDSKVQTDDIG